MIVKCTRVKFGYERPVKFIPSNPSTNLAVILVRIKLNSGDSVTALAID